MEGTFLRFYVHENQRRPFLPDADFHRRDSHGNATPRIFQKHKILRTDQRRRHRDKTLNLAFQEPEGGIIRVFTIQFRHDLFEFWNFIPPPEEEDMCHGVCPPCLEIPIPLSDLVGPGGILLFRRQVGQ